MAFQPDIDLMDEEGPEQDPALSDSQVRPDFLMAAIQSVNIATDDAFGFDDSELAAIGDRVVREFEVDEESRSEWKQKYDAALKLARQVTEEKSFPWPGAANVKYPLVTVASIQFAARAYGAIVQGRDVVKGAVVGNDDGMPLVDQMGQPVVDPNTGQPAWQIPPGAKRARADRIARHMSWQFLEDMPAWEDDTDLMLHVLPLVGSGFRKTYYDGTTLKPCSEYVSAEDLVANYHSRSIETAPRLTEIKFFYPYEIEERFRAGVWREIDLGVPAEAEPNDEEAPHEFLEQHRRLDLDEDGYSEPYIVTVHKETAEVVRITACFDAEGVQIDPQSGRVVRIEPIHYFTRYLFMPSFDGGFYGMGFGLLMQPINESINTTINQILDAATLQNAGGGIINSAISLKAGQMRFRPGEWKVMNLNSTAANPMIPVPAPGPSQVLFHMLGMLLEAGRDIGNIKEVLSGDAVNSQMPVGTTLALIEQGMQQQNAINKRVLRALGDEAKKLYRINRIYLTDEDYQRVLDMPEAVSKQDYAAGDADVVPVADPTMVTSMQKLGRAQYLAQFRGNPMVDQMELLRRELDAAGILDPETLIAEQGPTPEQAAMEAMTLLQAEKLRAEIDELKEKTLNERADSLKKLAEAEAAEAGPQLAAYQADLRSIGEMIRIRAENERAEKDRADRRSMGGMAR